MPKSGVYTNLGLPIKPTISDPSLFKELLKIYGAIEALSISLDILTAPFPKDASEWSQLRPSDTVLAQNQYRVYARATETIALGEIVTFSEAIENNKPILTMSLAGGSPWAGHAQGFSTQALTPANSFGEVMIHGLCTFIGGLTAGDPYFTSTTVSGKITPNIGGNQDEFYQPVGFALGERTLFFAPQHGSVVDTVAAGSPILRPHIIGVIPP